MSLIVDAGGWCSASRAPICHRAWAARRRAASNVPPEGAASAQRAAARTQEPVIGLQAAGRPATTARAGPRARRCRSVRLSSKRYTTDTGTIGGNHKNTTQKTWPRANQVNQLVLGPLTYSVYNNNAKLPFQNVARRLAHGDILLDRRLRVDRRDQLVALGPFGGRAERVPLPGRRGLHVLGSVVRGDVFIHSVDLVGVDGKRVVVVLEEELERPPRASGEAGVARARFLAADRHGLEVRVHVSLDQRDVDLRETEQVDRVRVPAADEEAAALQVLPREVVLVQDVVHVAPGPLDWDVVDGRRALEPIDDEDALGRVDARRLHVVPVKLHGPSHAAPRTAVDDDMGRHAAPASHELVVKTRVLERAQRRYHLPVDRAARLAVDRREEFDAAEAELLVLVHVNGEPGPDARVEAPPNEPPRWSAVLAEAAERIHDAAPLDEVAIREEPRFDEAAPEAAVPDIQVMRDAHVELRIRDLGPIGESKLCEVITDRARRRVESPGDRCGSVTDLVQPRDLPAPRGEAQRLLGRQAHRAAAAIVRATYGFQP